MKTRTVELHLIQSFPPSCVNRDGNNSPKDCFFGGKRRARISSQCLKRAIRQNEVFAETVGEEIATRSKRMRNEWLIPWLLESGKSPEDAEKLADDFRTKLAKDDKAKDQTSVALYFGKSELRALLDAYLAEEKKWQEAADRTSADIALFGRMLAEAPGLNVDAAAQVAHAISTHALSQNMDYWTAADDLKGDDDDAGASMIGLAEFNASVFYRYANVSIPILEKNLGGEEQLAAKTVEAFLRASYSAIPTGKQNGFAHGVPPVLALAVVRRKGMAINLCNAFIKPISDRDPRGFNSASADALLHHLDKMRKMAPAEDADYVLAHSLDDVEAPGGIHVVPGSEALFAKVLELV